jgi:hypothetical protein
MNLELLRAGAGLGPEMQDAFEKGFKMGQVLRGAPSPRSLKWVSLKGYVIAVAYDGEHAEVVEAGASVDRVLSSVRHHIENFERVVIHMDMTDDEEM